MSKAVITGSAANRHIKEVIHVITGVDVDTVKVNTQQQQTEQPLLTARVDNQIAVVKKYVDDKVASLTATLNSIETRILQLEEKEEPLETIAGDEGNPDIIIKLYYVSGQKLRYSAEKCVDEYFMDSICKDGEIIDVGEWLNRANTKIEYNLDALPQPDDYSYSLSMSGRMANPSVFIPLSYENLTQEGSLITFRFDILYSVVNPTNGAGYGPTTIKEIRNDNNIRLASIAVVSKVESYPLAFISDENGISFTIPQDCKLVFCYTREKDGVKEQSKYDKFRGISSFQNTEVTLYVSLDQWEPVEEEEGPVAQK